MTLCFCNSHFHLHVSLPLHCNNHCRRESAEEGNGGKGIVAGGSVAGGRVVVTDPGKDGIERQHMD